MASRVCIMRDDGYLLDGHRVAARAHEDDGTHEETRGAQEVLQKGEG